MARKVRDTELETRTARTKLDRRGKPEVAIVSLADLELLRLVEDQLDAEAMRAALADPENAELIPHEQVKRELGL